MLHDLNDVSRYEASECGTTFKPNLVDVEVNGRVSWCVREKLVSVYETIKRVEVIASDRLSKLTDCRGVQCKRCRRVIENSSW